MSICMHVLRINIDDGLKYKMTEKWFCLSLIDIKKYRNQLLILTNYKIYIMYRKIINVKTYVTA